MKKTIFAILLWSTGCLSALNANNKTTISFRHIAKYQFNSANNIEISTEVIENVSIPIQIRNGAFSVQKRIRCATKLRSLRDKTNPMMPLQFDGMEAVKRAKCHYEALLMIEGTLRDGKVLQVAVREIDKKFDCQYQNKTWSESRDDDAKLMPIGAMPYKNNASVRLRSKEHSFLLTLKNLFHKAAYKAPSKIKTADRVCPITNQALNNLAPRLPSDKVDLYAPLLDAAMSEFEINTPTRMAMFLAQLSHESDNFRIFKELGTVKTFHHYDNRRALGNIYPGDGYRFRGRGPLQITGRINYRNVGDALGMDLESNPELLEDPSIAFRASAWWWKKHGLNEKIDEFPNDVRRATKIINGGYKHLSNRVRKYNEVVTKMGKMEC
jgi:putative chitinase